MSHCSSRDLKVCFHYLGAGMVLKTSSVAAFQCLSSVNIML